MLWHPRPFWSYLGCQIPGGDCAGLGFALAYRPGIILFLMFMFSTFIVIERGLGPIDAMSESRRHERPQMEAARPPFSFCSICSDFSR